ECFSKALNQPTNKVTFSQKFIWDCGTPIVLTDVFIGWGTGNTNFCTGSEFQCPATSSKCYSLPPGQYIPIVTPSANETSATLCSTDPGGTTANFNLTSLENDVKGLQTNVTLSWFADIDLITPIGSGNPIMYNSTTADVYCKVTSNTPPNPYSVSKVTLTVVPSSAGGTAAAANSPT